MADFLMYNFQLFPPEPWGDVFIQDLANIGFESFEIEEGMVKAYVDEEVFSETDLAGLIESYKGRMDISMSVKRIEKRNWNSEWESNYEAVRLDERVLVRAFFHEADPMVIYNIVITPKMSFGTGHHATTKMMMSAMFDIDMKNALVMDVGSGTGILAILAEKMGAAEVFAIDIEDWAVENAMENVEINNCQKIVVEKAEIGHIKRKIYNVILANINYNVIVNDLPMYADRLTLGGSLLLSGFLPNECDSIVKLACFLSLEEKTRHFQDGWASIHLIKTRE